MAAPKIYKSTDIGAPILNGQYGSAIDVIRAVCVVGYGSKTPLGWTEEFSDTGIIVIKPSEQSVGNKLLYRFEDTNSIVYASSHMKFRVRSFESMSDANTGAGSSAVTHWYKSNATNTTPMPWLIIGDSSGFYFIENYTQGGAYAAYAELNYIGHGIRLFDDDVWFSMISGYTPATLNTLSRLSYIYAPTSTSYVDSIYISRNILGDVASIGYASGLKYNGGIGADALPATSGSIAAIPTGFNYPYKGQLLYSMPIVCEQGGAYGVRGYLPGFYVPQHSAGFTDRQIIEKDNKSFMVIRIGVSGITSAGYYGWVLIDIGEGFRV